MEFDRTPLGQDLQDVYNNCDQASQLTVSALIHLDDVGNTVTPQVVISFSDDRDFANNYAAEIGIEVEVPIGTYALKIYPNRTQLQMTVTQTRLKENSTAADERRPSESERFTAILIEDRAAPTQMQGGEVKTEESLNLLGTINLKFQLFSKTVEKLRVVQCGGPARQVKMAELMKVTISRCADAIKLTDTQKLLGVTMHPTDNQEVLEQAIVPHGTLVVDLPGYLQNRYGVYNAGIGTFIHNRQWYIYPLYDTNTFGQQNKTVSIYILPKRKFPELERTYRLKDDSLAILVTTDVDFRGDNDINYVQSGNGIRFLDASKVMNGFVEGKGNRGVVSRKANTNELLSTKQSTGITFAPISKRDISSNYCIQYTEMAAKKGGFLQLHWMNSNSAMILPGQCVRIVYFDKEEMKYAFGVIHRVQHMVTKVGAWTTPKHTSATKLTLFTNLRVGNQ
jgi:hypothetical protein